MTHCLRWQWLLLSRKVWILLMIMIITNVIFIFNRQAGKWWMLMKAHLSLRRHLLLLRQFPPLRPITLPCPLAGRRGKMLMVELTMSIMLLGLHSGNVLQGKNVFKNSMCSSRCFANMQSWGQNFFFLFIRKLLKFKFIFFSIWKFAKSGISIVVWKKVHFSVL